MTYAEAAEHLGKNAKAVQQLARRHKWPRQTPNDFNTPAKILVPEDLLVGATPQPAKKRPSRSYKAMYERERLRRIGSEEKAAQLELQLEELRQAEDTRKQWGLARRLKWAIRP